HHDSDRIYRFVTEEHSETVDYEASVPPAFGKAFRDDYTFAEKVARLCTEDDALIKVGSDAKANKFKINVCFAEPEFFDIFNFPLAAGDPRTILTELNTAVIDEATAKMFFGDDEAVGETFTLDNHIEFKVTGILHNFPENSDLRSRIFLSWATMPQYNAWYAADDSWSGITSSIQTFARLRPGVNPVEVEKVLPAYVKKYRPKSKNVHVYKLQPLSDVHFNPQYNGKISKTVLSLLSITAFLLVFMACLNFINIATAQAINRAREVGVRKSLGGTRPQLFWQFTFETAALVVISTMLAFAVAYSVLPYLTTLLKTNFTVTFSDYRLLLFAGLLILIVTFLAGAYPSFVLARFKPVAALKGKASDRQTGGFNLRRLLITTQFVIAQVLLIALIVFIYQMDKFHNADMGFDRNAIVLIPLGSRDVKANTLKSQFEQIPGVTHVTMCLGAPASGNNWTTMIHFDNRTEFEGFGVNFKSVDEDYLATFGLEVVAGRNLEPSDTVREFLVNETFVQKLGLKSADDILGRTIQANGASAPIVGVVRDFHEYSLHSNVGPAFMSTWKDRNNEYAVKINMANVQQTLAALNQAWSEMYPERYYSYQFLDDEIREFYETEETMLKLVMVFAAIALTIGCLGVYGLVSFMAVRKTKEIGIRKVLGGSIAHILWLFGREFSRLVLLAFLFAAPLG
ncbi:MAG TPA: ABC transporter permease, partial [Chryseosolibacter sp.]|nr:ABC transporter permease [Chryseosolibacter sp.]